MIQHVSFVTLPFLGGSVVLEVLRAYDPQNCLQWKQKKKKSLQPQQLVDYVKLSTKCP